MRLEISAKGVKGPLGQKVSELSGENLYACYNCGKCSAGCPSISEMDIPPNEVVRLVLFGDEDVLDCDTIWVCASCFTCTTRCPKGVDLSKIMEALRQIYLRKNVDKVKPQEIPEERAAELPQIALISSFRKCTS